MDYKTTTTGVIGMIIGGGLIMAVNSAPLVEDGTVTYERVDQNTVKITDYIVNSHIEDVTKLSEFIDQLQSQVDHPGTGPMSKEGLNKVKAGYVLLLKGAESAGVEAARVELDELISQGKVKPD